MTARVTERGRRAILECYAKYRSCKEVARILGRSERTVRRFAREAGLLRRPGRPRRDEARTPDVVELYARFGREQDVAEVLGVSRSTVHNRLQEAAQ